MPQRLKKLSDPLGTMSSQPTERDWSCLAGYSCTLLVVDMTKEKIQAMPHFITGY